MNLVVSGSKEDGVVSVPSEGSVSPGVGSIVHMVRASMGGGGGGAIGGGATGSQGTVISPVYWGVLVTVLIILNLPGHPGEAGVLYNREAGEGGHVHAIGCGEVDHQVPGHGGGRGDCGAQCNKDLRKCH